MNLEINFCNIVDSPRCNVVVNSNCVFTGEVSTQVTTTIPDNSDIELIITHWDKKPSDTVVENGFIVRDRSFEIQSITVDGINIEELIWQSEFRAVNGDVYPGCLFFGPNGDFVIKFTTPILKWLLEQRHLKNNNDPTWEQDYNFYITACNLLTQISNKSDS